MFEYFKDIFVQIFAEFLVFHDNTRKILIWIFYIAGFLSLTAILWYIQPWLLLLLVPAVIFGIFWRMKST